jgi:hypothetical protein
MNVDPNSQNGKYGKNVCRSCGEHIVFCGGKDLQGGLWAVLNAKDHKLHRCSPNVKRFTKEEMEKMYPPREIG